MKFLIVTDSWYLFNKYVEELLIKIDLKSNEIEYFDCVEVSFSEIETNLMTQNFFENKKLVILKNFDLLLIDKRNGIDFETFLNSDFENPLLVSFKDPSFLKSNEVLFNKFKTTNLISPIKNELESFVKNWFIKNSISIENKLIKNIITYNKNNFDLIIQVLNKIKLTDKKNIDEFFIISILSNFSIDAFFKLTNSLIQKDSKTFNDFIETLLKKNFQPFVIVTKLINDLLLFNFFIKDNNSSYLLNKMNINFYQVKFFEKSKDLWDCNKLNSLINKLIQLKINLQKKSFISDLNFYFSNYLNLLF